ncbi:HDIG domain-containing protein [Cnuella takakiae]|uniref:HDIG domain-containing protein n=1 Tax=Cnuella takakiae TaxID=1302690 RepID=A0A1M5BWW4_9BACT|nr:HDIG domain-containing metalloprotein [Cnuella takakiae]OLY93543.1 phosphohydrolase [Cnuella takakiae]SHF47018.1 HDIG domain-containing protein [Cnuella takakiae]
MAPKFVVAEIMDLFALHGAEDYDGEPVSQASHMMQCALIAEVETGDADLVVAGLLHDIGHLLKQEPHTETMYGFGVVNHELLGGAYLRARGFSPRVCSIVENHVAAKRYLVAKDEDYRRKLSPASLVTLQWQGGAMGANEARLFEQLPFFNDIIAVRRWDELGKDTMVLVPPPTYFEPVILQHLMRQEYLYASNY